MKLNALFSAMLLAAGTAQADPGVFVGITYDFSGGSSGFGLSLKALSTDKEDHGALGLGVTYYPAASQDKFGADLSAAYLFNNGAATLGWDFLNNKPQAGIGYVNTDDDDRAPAPIPVPSDRRLKRDIVYLVTLESGIRLYSFRYTWSNEMYVGVMAQDLLQEPLHSHAVKLMPGNFYAVDYRSLGLQMITLRKWRESHDNIFTTALPV